MSIDPVPYGEIHLESPPELPEQAADGFSQALTYLPMGAMAIGMAAMMAGGHTSAIGYVGGGAMGVGMTGMMAGQFVRGRGDRKVKLNGQRRDYLRYLAQVREKTRKAGQQQRAALLDAAPPPEALITRVLGQRVWHRAPANADFLNVRFATATQALAVRLVPPETKPLEDLDPLCAGALRRFVRANSTVPELPVAIRLSSVARIVFTGDRAAARGLARAMIAQLASAHSPRDVRISVSATDIAEWEWLKWLPHTMHPDESDAAGPVRLMVPEPRWLDAMLGAGIEDRPRFTPGNRAPELPFHAVIIDGDGYPEPELAGASGVVILDLSGTEQHDEVATLALHVTREVVSRGEQRLGVPDALDRHDVETLARLLAPLRPPDDGATSDALTSDTTLTTLLGIDDPRALDVAALWRKRAPRDLLRVPIGTTESGAPLELDIKESAQGGMGPHGLVVGATGSGKSELLRTLVLGLALTHDPRQLNFVLVDFKGGATFLGLDKLPHVSAVITNLADELPLVDRMRDALSGELVRRQELLRKAGNYASLRDYTAAGNDPVPTLFLVLDEFSELLAAKPEFIDLFVTIGRVGRSLGVHLLLASQRLEEGRLRGLDTQLSYRIGLRTFSAQESRTVLGVPDAYELPSVPGSGFLKADGQMSRFKAAYVSGPALKNPGTERRVQGPSAPFIVEFGPAYTPGPVVTEKIKAETDSGGTLLDEVAVQLAGRGTAAHRIWLPPLAEPPSLDRLPVPGPLRAALGLVDKPFEQRRDALLADLSGAAGHLAIAGAPRSGKSTLLRTLVCSLALTSTPAEAQFYLLDFGGGTLTGLDGLPHVGGAATRLQSSRVRRTVSEVRTVLERREKSFADAGIDSIATYRRRVADGSLPGDGHGDVFLVVDGWLTLRQDFEDLEPVVTALAARGLGYGVHVVAATGKWSEFRPGIRDLFGTRLELRLGDPYESEIGRAAAGNVPADAPGRGLTREGLHFMAAVPRLDRVCSASGLPAASADLVRQLAAAWTGPTAPPVRMLPESLPVASLPAAAAGAIPFAIDEDALAPVCADFGSDPHLLILGDTESGKSNLLRVLCAGLTTALSPSQARLVFVDYRRSLLDSSECEHSIGYATSAVAATRLLKEVREALASRLPPPDLSAAELRSRSWWKGSDVYVIVDDYDLVSGSGTPLLELGELLPQAADIGLHVILARSAGGAGRAMFEPVIQRLREMGSPGLIMSGSKDEGALLGGVRASALPPGRGVYVHRRAAPRLVQVALHPAAP